MIDAWAKGDHRLNYGFVSDFGKFDACIDLEVEEDGDHFKGRHCAVDVRLPVPEEGRVPFKPMVAVKLNLSSVNLDSTVYQYYADRIDFWTRESFAFGTCFPSTCSREDVILMAQSVAKQSHLEVGVRKYCDAKDEQWWNLRWTPTVVSSLFLGWFILSLTAIATWLHVFREWYGLPIPVLIPAIEDHWNLVRHVQSLVKPDRADDRMRPIESLVTIAQVGAICAHYLQAGTLFSTQFRKY